MAEQISDDFFDVPEEEASGDIRARLSNMVRSMRQLQVELADTERRAGELKSKIAEYETRRIPDALLEAGLTEITTMEGLKVKTRPFVGAIPADRKAIAFDWMDKHGHSSIIKRQVSVQFDKGSTEAAEKAVSAIAALGLTPKTTLDVHYQTFQSFAKEQLAKGVQLPLDEWGVFYGQKAVISEK